MGPFLGPLKEREQGKEHGTEELREFYVLRTNKPTIWSSKG